MKKIIAFVFLFLSLWANAQNEQLAQNYYDRGEFEKAVVSYEELLKNNPGNSLFFQRTVECYQQLQQFDKAEKALQARLEKFKQSNLLIELGYNYQLQKDEAKAKKLVKNNNKIYGKNTVNRNYFSYICEPDFPNEGALERIFFHIII